MPNNELSNQKMKEK